jgi:hypothetical protein
MVVPIFVQVETGTDNKVVMVINPTLLYIAEFQMAQIREQAKLFGFGGKEEESCQIKK